MKKMKTFLSVIACIALFFSACGKSAQAPGGEATAASQSAGDAAAPASPAAAAPTGIRKISDMANAWSALYNLNEKAINDYEGMPIMGLVTPPLAFAAAVQFDIMNPNDQEGRFEGKLMMAGYRGFVEKSGSRLTFGYDDTLAKDGFGPSAKAGDRVAGSGSLALDPGYFIWETYSERAGKKIDRSYTEFKRLADGSMVCLSMGGRLVDFRGNENPSDDAIYLHNGAGRYDFVIAKGKTGPAFQSISFAEKGDLTKEQALELFKAAGYTIEQSGGIQGAKLALDK